MRWNLQRGVAVIPKSTTPSRIASNFALHDFELDDQDMVAISGLNRDLRLTGAPWAVTTPARTYMQGKVWPPKA